MEGDDRPSPRADLIGALVWIVLGATIVTGSWRMDRLESQGATLYTAPGLVPGLLGAVITLLGLLLARRALAMGGLARGATAATGAGGGRFALALALSLIYAIGLVGHAPFWLATLVFVTAFVALFEYPMRRERNQIRRGLAMALVYGAATSAVVSLVFEQIFLVRLP